MRRKRIESKDSNVILRHTIFRYIRHQKREDQISFKKEFGKPNCSLAEIIWAADDIILNTIIRKFNIKID